MINQSDTNNVIKFKICSFAEVEGWYFAVLVTYIFELIAAFILIVGIHKDDKNMLIPWIRTSIAMVTMDTAVLIFQCVKLVSTTE